GMGWTGSIQTGYGAMISNAPNAAISLVAGAGTSYQGAGSTIANNGTITITGTGTSTFGDTFNNAGILNVQSGVLSLTGATSLTNGTIQFGLSNTNSFGKIIGSESLALAGTLSASLLNGFVPALSNSFTVLTYASHVGMFANTSLPPSDAWQLNYDATAL